MLQLQKIRLENFRNYVSVELPFPSTLNIIFGKNAQGKTNLLEAIALLCLGRSFRSKKETELVRWGAENTFLCGEFLGDEFQTKVELGIGLNEKRAKIDGQPVKHSAIFGQRPVVLFSPDDLQLIKGGPGHRRDFLDLYLAQIEPSYRALYYDYHKVLQQRNRFLKSAVRNLAELDIWNEQLVEKGVNVTARRFAMIDSVQEAVTEAQYEISGAREQLKITYLLSNEQPLATFSVLEFREWFYRELKKMQCVEFERRITMVGPHRDDLKLTVGNEVELRHYGSQGQQRTAALALKLGLVKKIKESRGVYPILLLDDVMSEFDDHRKKALLQLLTGTVQTFLTSTGRQDFPIKTAEAAFYLADQGEITVVG